MKEATGDMTMTVIVVVGAIAVLALARPIWNIIGNKITNTVNDVNTKTSYVEIIDYSRL